MDFRIAPAVHCFIVNSYSIRGEKSPLTTVTTVRDEFLGLIIYPVALIDVRL